MGGWGEDKYISKLLKVLSGEPCSTAGVLVLTLWTPSAGADSSQILH